MNRSVAIRWTAYAIRVLGIGSAAAGGILWCVTSFREIEVGRRQYWQTSSEIAVVTRCLHMEGGFLTLSRSCGRVIPAGSPEAYKWPADSTDTPPGSAFRIVRSAHDLGPPGWYLDSFRARNSLWLFPWFDWGRDTDYISSRFRADFLGCGVYASRSGTFDGLTEVTVHCWVLVAAPAAVLGAIAIWRRARCKVNSPALVCSKCGYDLRASKDRCPECGTPIPLDKTRDRPPGKDLKPPPTDPPAEPLGPG